MFYVIAEVENAGKQILRKFEKKEDALEWAKNAIGGPLLDVWVNNEQGEWIK